MFAENILLKNVNAVASGLLKQILSEIGRIAKSCVANRGTLVALVIMGYGVYKCKHLIAHYFRTRVWDTLRTWCLSKCSSEIMPDLRQRFKDESCLSVMSHNTLRNHSHAESAIARGKANTFMDHFINCIGRVPYSISMSKSQRVNNAAGSRLYHTIKDLQMEPSYCGPTSQHVITMTDVDYYVDLPHELDGQPVLMYTFVPNTPAGKTTNGVYCTHEDDTIEMIINGGARYRHPIWDFDTDHLVIDHLFYSIVYLVEQIKITDDRRIVFLNPIRKVYGPLARWVSGKRLTRRAFNHSGINFTRFLGQESGDTVCYYSLSKPGEFQCCTIPSNTFSTAFIRTTECREPNLGQIERVFNHAKVPKPLDSAALYFDAYKRAPSIFGLQPMIVTPCVDQHTYQTCGPLVFEDGKPSMRAIWPGYCGNTFSPAKSYNNDAACIAGRITEPKNKEPRLPPMYFTFYQEFIKNLVPDTSTGTLAPLNHDEMADKFCRPTQRMQIEQVKTTMLMVDPVVKSFQKAEAYPKIVHPRNISTLPMDHNFCLGQFMYPFMEHFLKPSHWYAFGRTPKDIGILLQAKAQQSNYAVPTDADKLDGSVRGMLRDLFLSCMLRAYPTEYHQAIRRLENKERHISASTAHGIKYDTGDTILSGSVITSVLGSTINAFLNYCALRQHHSAETAYDALGLYGGDDGVTFDMPPNTLMRTVAKFGMSYKAEAIDAGNPVPFLGRIYLDPWTCPESMCDMQRQIRKMHLTATPKIVPSALVLYRKALGLRTTDPETPVIKEWCDAVLRLAPLEVPGLLKHRQFAATIVDRSYWSKYDTDVQFSPPTDRDYALTLVMDNLDATLSAVEHAQKVFREAKTITDLFVTNLFTTEMKVAVDAIVGGELVRATPRETIPEMVNRKAKLQLTLCRNVQLGKLCKFGDKCVFSHHRPTGDTPPKTSTNVRKHIGGSDTSPKGRKPSDKQVPRN